jgi:hypothetical protein
VVGDLTNDGVAGGTSESWHPRPGVAAAPAVAPQHFGGSGDAWGACRDVARYIDENFSRNAYGHAARDRCAAGRAGGHVIYPHLTLEASARLDAQDTITSMQP